MTDQDEDIVKQRKAFLDKVDPIVRNIVNVISRNDEEGSTSQYLITCEKEIDKILKDFKGDIPLKVFKNQLICALKDAIRQRVYLYEIAPNGKFDMTEKEFLRLFGYDLNLFRSRLTPYPRPEDEQNYGPSRFQRYPERGDRPDSRGPEVQNDDPALEIRPAPPHGAVSCRLDYECAILENLHRRLTALEARMGSF